MTYQFPLLQKLDTLRSCLRTSISGISKAKATRMEGIYLCREVDGRLLARARL